MKTSTRWLCVRLLPLALLGATLPAARVGSATSVVAQRPAVL